MALNLLRFYAANVGSILSIFRGKMSSNLKGSNSLLGLSSYGAYIYNIIRTPSNIRTCVLCIELLHHQFLTISVFASES